MELLTIAKAELLRSNNDAEHPFRYLYFGTFGHYPEIRTVVNREVTNDLSVIFFTDSRTPKIQQIQNDPNVSAMFYHPLKQLQIRMKGKARLIDEDHSAYPGYFQQVQQGLTKKDYSSMGIPGTPSKDESEIIYGDTIHLMVVKIVPAELDIVQLGQERHYRSRYVKNDMLWIETKLVP